MTKYGDAIFETSSDSSNSNSWFSDYSGFVNQSLPLFRRGGYCDSNSNAGLFYFVDGSGDAFKGHGFRPVCIIK